MIIYNQCDQSVKLVLPPCLVGGAQYVSELFAEHASLSLETPLRGAKLTLIPLYICEEL